MTDLLTPARAVAAIKFKWQKDEKTYDYFVPNGLEVVAGDKVMVATSRGETEVTVVEIKTESDKAEKDILRRVEAPAEEKPVGEWDF
jgi:primosomal protein N'